MITRIFPSLSAALLFFSPWLLAEVGAGETGATPLAWEQAPAPDAAEPELAWETSAGYDSEYVYRGVSYAEDLIWVQLALDLAVSNLFNLWLGGWGATDSAGDYTEVDLMAELGMTWEEFYLGLGANYYIYPETGEEDEFELALTVEYSLGETPLSLVGHVYRNLTIDGWFFDGGVRWESELTDRISLEATVLAGYNRRCYIEGSGFNNVEFRLALPIAIADWLTIAPYAAATLSLDVLDAEGAPSLGYGGIAATASF